MLLQIAREDAPAGVTIFRLTGRITLGNSCKELEWTVEKAVESGCAKVVIDLNQIERVDSAGVGILTLSAGLLRKAGGQLRISGAHGFVDDLVKLTKLDTIIPFHPDVESAIAAFSAPQSARQA